ncbi:GNAT family N-acetyltransferase [Arthrobacter subterraneus]|uniref:GNAT family N-acetyltransferase n=1 Tax=Arthrobacter subterraneus TaxID=335973 RepID=UPI003CCB7E8D
MRTKRYRFNLEAVSERENRIVSWISFKISPCNPEVLAVLEDSSEDWLHISDIFVDLQFRWTGVGAELLNYAENEGRSCNVRYSILMPASNDDGMDPEVRQFYENCGYYSMEPSPKYHHFRDPWLMGLHL